MIWGLRTYIIMALAVCLAGMAAMLGLQTHRLNAAKLELAEYKAEVAAERAQQLAETVEQARQAAQETLRRLTAQQEVQRAYETQIARARADARRADAAAGQLRQQAAALAAAARRASGDTTAAGVGPAAGTALDLFAELLSRSDETSGILAAALDRSYAAGAQCSAAYDALTAGPAPPVSPGPAPP